MCELAKAIETNLAAVATATQAASDAKADAAADATAKDAALKKELLAEIGMLKEAVTNDLSGRMAAVEQDMKDAAKANTKIQQDLKATVDGDLGKATKQIIDLQKKDTSLTSIITGLSAKYDTLQKSVASLEEASKCNFRGNLNKDGKKCTCSAGFQGDFCEIKEPDSCKEVLENDAGAKDGLYTIAGKVVYCVMDKKWAGSGGWRVWTMFGDTGDFGADVSKTTRKVRIKASGQGFPANGQGAINNKFKSYNNGWTSNTNHVWHGYCNSGGGDGKKYAFDWHNSGSAVGEVYLTLPTGFTEFSTKFGNCYSGCSTVLYQDGNRIAKRDSCGGSKRNCFTVKGGTYNQNNNKLKWKEQDGTCVGSIFWVLVR